MKISALRPVTAQGQSKNRSKLVPNLLASKFDQISNEDDSNLRYMQK